MGRDVSAITVSKRARRRYTKKVQRCLDAFETMLRESRFQLDPPKIGVEIELNLVDEEGRPAMRNEAVLAAIADPAWSTELGQFNIEINLPPCALTGKSLSTYEQTVRDSLNHAETQARASGAHLMMVGILPTLREADAVEETLSSNPRYRLLNEQILAARGENLRIDIDGVERLQTYADSITPEAACTSVQFHLQVGPENFAAYWNASQAIAGVQVALAPTPRTCSASELWRETRIPLFEQATDTRSREAAGAGRTAAGVVRRTLDRLGLRPVRGERPLLLGAAADHATTRTR